MSERNGSPVADYNASREPGTDTSVLCHAPFVSLNFDQLGRVTACCYSRLTVLGSYPSRSLREIWTGPEARAMRDAFLQDRENQGCSFCFHQLRARNFSGALMRNFDRFSRDERYRPEIEPPMPRVLEFEISNLCNLECIMCNGHWSSSIRANRERLPPLRGPYDRAFVEQLVEFLPSIAAAKFLGGEPFLIKLYYEIWERLARLNPDAELSITTNATIVPDRARELLEKLRAHIVVSLDAVDAATFESIRKNARFDRVMANLEDLLAYTRRRKTDFTLAVCPMTYNWRQLPALLEFCAERRINLHFNTLLKPPEAALAALPEYELAEVIEHLESHRPTADEAWWERANLEAWDDLILQLRSWREEKLKFIRDCEQLENRFREFVARHPDAASDWSSADSFERLASPLVRSLRTGQERAAQATTWGRQYLLPRVVEIEGESGGPEALDLLLGTHLLCRALDDAEAGGAIATDALLEEQRKLRAHLAGHDSEGIEALRRVLRERVCSGQGDALIPWVKTLLNFLMRPGSPVRALEKGLAELRSLGRTDTERRKALEYFKSMALGYVPLPRVVPLVGEVAAANPRLPSRLPPIRGLGDLRCLSDAVYLFRRFLDPDGDPSALRQRLDDLLNLITGSGQVEATCRRLETGQTTVSDLLAFATED